MVVLTELVVLLANPKLELVCPVLSVKWETGERARKVRLWHARLRGLETLARRAGDTPHWDIHLVLVTA